MKTTVQSYLFFNGCCEEALEFYGQALGAQVDFIMRYSDSPEPAPEGMVPAGYENKIMHASFRVGDTVLMASDDCTGAVDFKGFSLSMGFETPAEAQAVFTALSEGGVVTMPLSETFWAKSFGMLKDKFGMGWMISVENPQH